ncbi:MAG: DedA family protein [Fervidicoccaceae archaeon]
MTEHKEKVFFFIFLLIAVLLIGISIYIIQLNTGSSIVERIINFSTAAVEKIGYLGIFVTMTLESALVPIPSEVVMTFAGFLAWTGKMNIFIAIIAGTLGNLIGSFLLYKAGSSLGLELVKKYGKYVLIDNRDIENAQQLFLKYGGVIVLVGRMLPAIRTVISLPAGISRMNSRSFLFFTLIGSIPWNSLLVYLGWLLGENWIIVQRYARILDYFVIFALILLIVLYIRYKRKPVKGALNEC